MVNTKKYIIAQEYNSFEDNTSTFIFEKNNFDLSSFLENDYDNRKFLVLIEANKVEFESTKILQISSDNLEIKVELSDNKKSLPDDILLSNSLYIEYNNSFHKVDQRQYKSNIAIFSFEDELRKINRKTKLNFYIFEETTDYLQFEFENESPKNYTKVLSSRSSDRYNKGVLKRENNKKTFGEILSKYEEDQSSNINNLRYFKTDYSEFSNFNKYGSAYQKVKNARQQIQNIRETKITNVRNNLIEKLTPFENFLYKKSYNLNETQFNDLFDVNEEQAAIYDKNNVEYLLYRFPEEIVGDENSTTSLFISMFGEVFDEIWITYKHILGKLNIGYDEAETITNRFVRETLKEYGIKTDLTFVTPEINQYLKDNNSYQNISEELSKRFLNNIFYFYKGKGTKKTIEDILNLYGLNKKYVDVVESNFSNYELSSQKIENIKDAWHLDKPFSSNISYNIEDGYFDFYTFYFSFKNINTNFGYLLNFSSEFKIGYEVQDDQYKIFLEYQDEKINEQDINILPFEWNNFFVEYNEDIIEPTEYVLKISNYIDENIQDEIYFNIPKEFIDGFAEVTLFEESTLSTLFFKVFNGYLDEEEKISITQNPFSISTKFDYDLASVQFTLPDIGYFDSPNGKPYLNQKYATLSFVSGNEITLYIDNINVNDFSNEEIQLNSDIKALPYASMLTKNIFIDGENEKTHLYRKNKEKKFVNDNIHNIGVFVNPAHKYNSEIANSIGKFDSIIPSPYDDGLYEFETTREKSEYIKFDYSFYPFYFLSKIIYDNIYKIIEEFVPTNTDFTYGVVYQNHLLNKPKEYYEEKNLVFKAKNVKQIGSINNFEDPETFRSEHNNIDLHKSLESIINDRLEGDVTTNHETDAIYKKAIMNDYQIEYYTTAYFSDIDGTNSLQQVEQGIESGIVIIVNPNN